ncbi:MAG: nucleoside-diphosphate kinase [Actinomycetota bacterium]
METTLVLVKPDGVRRGLVGEVIGRIEHKSLRLAGVRMLKFDEDLARSHYHEHVERPFFPDLLEFITSGPVVALAVEGERAVSIVRAMMGATDPAEAAPGTLRGDFCTQVTQNLMHGSDSVESAHRELELFFPGLGSGPNGGS